MDGKRRRDLALAGAAVLLLAIAAWRVQRGTAPSTDAAAPVGAAAIKPKVEEKGPVAELDLTALETERPEPEESSRNPFRFKPRPAPAPSAATIKQQQQQAAAAEQAAREPVEPPPPPRIPLKYIGEMADPKNPGKKIAILSDTRSTYHGGEGDVIEGRYRIVRIGVESIELTYLDGRGRQTIRQTGQ